MFFTSKEKARLWGELRSQSVDLGVIKNELVAGKEKFSELEKGYKWTIKHKERHRTLNWAAGGLGTFLTVAALLWETFGR